VQIVSRFMRDVVRPVPPAHRLDVFRGVREERWRFAMARSVPQVREILNTQARIGPGPSKRL